jgi:nucleotidyltransferase/DNA polymerase involved in DNA repair
LPAAYQQKIFEKTGLRAFVGVSVNKFLVKIASDWKKSNGFFVIPPKEAEKKCRGRIVSAQELSINLSFRRTQVNRRI